MCLRLSIVVGKWIRVLAAIVLHDLEEDAMAHTSEGVFEVRVRGVDVMFF